MTRIAVEDISDSYYNSFIGNGGLRAFYLEGDEIVLSGSVSAAPGFIVVSYYMRPNTMVSENNAAVVTNVNKNNGLVTVDKVPESFLNVLNFDITSSKSAFRLVAKEITPDGYISDTNLNYTFGTIKKITSTLPLFSSLVSSSYITVTDNSNGLNTLNVFWIDLTASAAPIVPNANIYRVNCTTATSNADVITALSNLFNSTFVDNRLIMTAVTSDSFAIENGGIGISVGDNFTITNTIPVIQVVDQAGTITIPAKLQINDVIALPEETTIPQIPIELHSMLAQRAAMRCLESLGDNTGLQAAAAKLADMEAKTASLIDNRVESSPLKVVPRHGLITRTQNNIYRGR
jgi:hypothetical protein